MAPIQPVIREHQRRRWYRLGFPVAFRRPAFASRVILLPLRNSAFLTVGPPGATAWTYGTNYTYNTNGTPAIQTATTKPGATDVGGLPLETLTFTYNTVGQPSGLTAGTQTYLNSTAYGYDGQIEQQLIGPTGDRVQHTLLYEPSTRRLQTSQVDTEYLDPLFQQPAWHDKATDNYTYDRVGNIQSIAGKTAGVTDQVECYDYDYLRRLTDAWTESSLVCDSANHQRAGADLYRLAWTFDDSAPVGGVIKTAGLRKTETVYWGGTSTSTSTYNGAVALLNRWTR